MTRKLWIWITAVLSLFASVVLVIDLLSEKNYKKAILSSRLEAYSEIVSKSGNYKATIREFPDNIRVTVLRKDGLVAFDSMEENARSFDNHLDRPEIIDCLSKGEGYSIRRSDTFSQDFIYYARSYGDLIIRTSMPFEVGSMKFFHPDWTVLVTLVFAFFATVLTALLITERFSRAAKRETEERLRLQKQHMTNNIAHELRTPVTSIRGYLETLAGSPDMDEDHRNLFINRAYQQSLRLSDLIRDIALVTKMAEAPEMLEKVHLGVRKISEEVLEEFAGQLRDKHIKVENLISDQCSISGNPILIYSIFRNLVENSIRYAGEGVTIHMEESGEEEGHYNFTFFDTGRGVPDSLLEKIFERFYTITPEGVNVYDGSGLGLSIVKNAVIFHSGSIEAMKHEPQGLEIRFSLKV